MTRTLKLADTPRQGRATTGADGREKQHDANSRSVSTLFASIQDDLVAVEQLLCDELRSDAPFVDELLKYGCLLGGKRLRPALLLLSGKAVGSITDEHRVLAAVVEMIHTATLVHDDVLDDASMRRHVATVNSRWDNQTSVLLGDFLFTHAFYLASTLGSTFACRTIGRATNIVCEGELRQIATRGDFLLDETEYLAIIEAKTAELCACCCRLGAHYAGATADVVDRLIRYGRALGIAFQIMDDLMDLVGDETASGKSLGTDLDKQKPTMPLIHALQCASAPERKEILHLFNGKNGQGTFHADLMTWLDRFDALNVARKKARLYASQAREQLDALPASPTVDVLHELAEFVVSPR
jgi:octaprenyl-diphosphate synthase